MFIQFNLKEREEKPTQNYNPKWNGLFRQLGPNEVPYK